MSGKDMNVSQFIANLNSLEPIEYNQGQRQDEELSLFSNTHFFDFDMGRSTDIAATVDDLLMQQEKQLQNPKFKLEEEVEEHRQRHGNSAANHGHAGMAGIVPLDFNTLQEFSIASELPVSNANGSSSSSTFSSSSKLPVRAKREAMSMNSTAYSPASTETGNSSPQESLEDGSKKRKASSAEVGDNGTPVAIEEDKRRRNTAASARFRIKKKLREQEMERSSRELQDKVTNLETKVMQLQMENRWLKNLVVEKNEARDVSDLLDMKKRIVSSTGQDAS